MPFKLKTLVSGVAVALAGCSNMHTDQFMENKDIANDLSDDVNAKKDTGIEEIEAGLIVDDFFVDLEPYTVPEQKSSNLPTYLPKTITYIQQDLKTEREFSALMLKEYGLKIVFSRLVTIEEDDDESTDTGSEGMVGEEVTSEPEGAVLINTMPSDYYPSEGEEQSQNNTSEPLNAFDLKLEKIYNGEIENPDPDLYVNTMNFSGSLADFMDLLASDRELSWKFDEVEGQFVLYDLDTVVFEVIDNTDQFKSETKISTESETTSKEEGSSASAATSQTVEFNDDANHWKSLQETVNSLLSPEGKATFDQKNGMVIVTDRQPILNKVGKLVDHLNESNGVVVFLDVEYVKVALDKSSNIGVDIDATDFLSSIGSGSTTGGLSNSLDLQATFSSIFSMNFTNAGVSAMIGSLQKQGNMTVRYEMPISTINNTPHPYQTAESRTYIHKVEAEKDDEGKITSVIPETKVNKTGITSIFKPRVIGDRVIVEGTLTLSENIDMDVKEDMGSIMLPTNTGETHKVKSIIPNGVTRVVSIQTLTKTSGNSEGAFGEDSWFFGGGEKSETSREVAMVLVTPYIVK